jgi:hypothetical protein
MQIEVPHQKSELVATVGKRINELKSTRYRSRMSHDSTFLLILSVHLAVGTPRLERNDSRGLLPARRPMRFDCNLCCNT